MAVPIVRAAAGPVILHCTDPPPLPLCASTWNRTTPARAPADAGSIRTTAGAVVAATHVATTPDDGEPMSPSGATAATSYRYIVPSLPPTSVNDGWDL